MHKRQAREVARLEAEREERRRRAAERRAREALEAEQRAASIPIKSVVPGALLGGEVGGRGSVFELGAQRSALSRKLLRRSQAALVRAVMAAWWGASFRTADPAAAAAAAASSRALPR